MRCTTRCSTTVATTWSLSTKSLASSFSVRCLCALNDHFVLTLCYFICKSPPSRAFIRKVQDICAFAGSSPTQTLQFHQIFGEVQEGLHNHLVYIECSQISPAPKVSVHWNLLHFLVCSWKVFVDQHGKQLGQISLLVEQRLSYLWLFGLPEKSFVFAQWRKVIWLCPTLGQMRRNVYQMAMSSALKTELMVILKCQCERFYNFWRPGWATASGDWHPVHCVVDVAKMGRH